MKIKDRTAIKYGRLQPLRIDSNSEKGKIKWICKCDCGNEISVLGTSLGNDTNSCGCLKKELTAKRLTTHGLSNTRTYNAWWAMKLRCYYPSSRHYYRYGGKGITICDSWNEKFENFLKDMGKCPSNKHSIDRIDSTGNYEPSNCYWATPVQQSQNISTNLNITWNGETKCVSQWERDLGLPLHFLQQRITRRGWTIEKAFTTPKLTCKQKSK